MTREQFLKRAQSVMPAASAEALMADLEKAHEASQRGRLQPRPIDWSEVTASNPLDGTRLWDNS